jgi:transposase-like protein
MSEEKQRAILETYRQTGSQVKTAAIHGVSVKTVQRLRQLQASSSTLDQYPDMNTALI